MLYVLQRFDVVESSVSSKSICVVVSVLLFVSKKSKPNKAKFVEFVIIPPKKTKYFSKVFYSPKVRYMLILTLVGIYLKILLNLF